MYYIGHVVSVDAQTNKQTNKHRKRKAILGPAVRVLRTLWLVKMYFVYTYIPFFSYII